MAHIGSQWWTCKPCGYRVQTHDAHGKPYKKLGKTCPSCGASVTAPAPATKD